jgi:preprotein translocase subunit YajC
MNRLVIIVILLVMAVPLYAQAQQPDAAKLKADAQKVVSIIKGDKAKTQTYCQVSDIAKQMDEAVQEKDRKKAEELSQKLTESETHLGPEYLALVESLRNMDLTSKDGQEIASTFDKLDESCAH